MVFLCFFEKVWKHWSQTLVPPTQFSNSQMKHFLHDMTSNWNLKSQLACLFVDPRQTLSVEVSVELRGKASTVIVFASMCNSLSCCLSPEQPRWADDDGEQEDQPAGPGRVPEEERNGTAWKLPPQDTQPDAHVGAAGGNTHTHTQACSKFYKWKTQSSYLKYRN